MRPPGEKWPESESDDYTSTLLSLVSLPLFENSNRLAIHGSVDSRFENRNRDADSAPRTTPDGVLWGIQKESRCNTSIQYSKAWLV